MRILLFLLWGMNWCYICTKPLSRPFTFWSTFEEQLNLLSVPTLSCCLSHCAAHTSLMVYSYSCFSPGVILIAIQGQRWSSSQFTRACVSHLSYFLGLFMELFVFSALYLFLAFHLLYIVFLYCLVVLTFFLWTEWWHWHSINIWRINVHLSCNVSLLASHRIMSRNI